MRGTCSETRLFAALQVHGNEFGVRAIIPERAIQGACRGALPTTLADNPRWIQWTQDEGPRMKIDPAMLEEYSKKRSSPWRQHKFKKKS